MGRAARRRARQAARNRGRPRGPERAGAAPAVRQLPKGGARRRVAGHVVGWAARPRAARAPRSKSACTYSRTARSLPAPGDCPFNSASSALEICAALSSGASCQFRKAFGHRMDAPRTRAEQSPAAAPAPAPAAPAPAPAPAAAPAPAPAPAPAARVLLPSAAPAAVSTAAPAATTAAAAAAAPVPPPPPPAEPVGGRAHVRGPASPRAPAPTRSLDAAVPAAVPGSAVVRALFRPRRGGAEPVRL